jgi:hypothetical protein
MFRSKFSFVSLIASLALIVPVLATPSVAVSAPPADISVSITCPYGRDVDVYLPAGTSIVTLNNNNNCNSAGSYPSASLAYGNGATFTYTKTINGVTSGGNYAVFDGNFETGQLAPGDSFSLTQVSSLGKTVRFYFGNRPSIYVHFYAPMFDSITVPITIGAATTLSGSNLLDVTNISFFQAEDFIRFFVAPTSTTSTSLTFTMPTSYQGFFGPGGNVSVGTYSIIPGTRDFTGQAQSGSVIAAPPATVEADAAAEAAVAAASRAAERQSARAEIVTRYKDSKLVEVELFSKAEIAGVSTANINQINTEVLSFPEEIRGDLTAILKVARKYEVVALIASPRVKTVVPALYIEIGLISSESKNRTLLVNSVKRLPEENRSSYEDIKSAIELENASIQKRADRLAKILARSLNRSGR